LVISFQKRFGLYDWQMTENKPSWEISVCPLIPWHNVLFY